MGPVEGGMGSGRNDRNVQFTKVPMYDLLISDLLKNKGVLFLCFSEF
jgi:hypothetical protein